MVEKLTRTIKKQITKEWNELFPSMGIYKNMWLMNILGPLAVGVLLEVKSDNERYIPTFHIHNLSENTDFVTLTVSVTDGLNDISLRSKKDKYQRIAQNLKDKAIIPYEGDIEIDIIIMLLKREYEKRFIVGERKAICSMLMYLAGWSGKPFLKEDVEKYIEQKISDGQLNFSKDVNETITFYNELKHNTELSFQLHNNVEQQIKLLKMENLPRRKIIID